MVKAILRGLVGLATLPLIFGIYWAIFAVLIALGAGYGGNFADNLWSIGLAWVLFLVLYPVISRLLNKVVA
jgi:hypothetical protein